MKNNTQPQDTEPKAKMLFNSDGFDLVVKVIIEIFKIFGMILIAVFSIIGVLLSANSKKEQSKGVSDNLVTNNIGQAGYNSKGKRII